MIPTGHHTHKIIGSGDGYEESFEAYCEKCWKSYEFYSSIYKSHNGWIDKRCQMRRFGWRKIFEHQLDWWHEFLGERHLKKQKENTNVL